MAETLLHNYANNILGHPLDVNYLDVIPLYQATLSEIKLLNEINMRHSKRSYYKELLPLMTYLMKADDLLSFHRHLISEKGFAPQPNNDTLGRARSRILEELCLGRKMPMIDNTDTIAQTMPKRFQNTNCTDELRPMLAVSSDKDRHTNHSVELPKRSMNLQREMDQVSKVTINQQATSSVKNSLRRNILQQPFSSTSICSNNDCISGIIQNPLNTHLGSSQIMRN